MSDLTATEYQLNAKETAIYPKKRSLEYLALGLSSESGEVAGKIKKLLRDKTKLNKQDLGDEIGDVLWYCAMLAEELSLDLGNLMENNLKKLHSRKERGVISGSGDKR